MKMTNRWNKLVYRLWAPIYDATVNQFFMPGRKQAMRALALQKGERVLLVGVGTGADLPLLPPGVQATGIDLSRDMLRRARTKLPLPGRQVSLLCADAQQPLFASKSFDTAILNLVLSVVPDGAACLKAAMGALKPGGRMVIFDKFLPDQAHPGFIRWILNFFSTLIGTDINRRFKDLTAGCQFKLVQNEASLANGMYRVILLKKTAAEI